MGKINKYDILIAGIVIFAGWWLWNVAITNHAKDIERDKFYASHCKQVSKEGLLSTTYACKN